MGRDCIPVGLLHLRLLLCCLWRESSKQRFTVQAQHRAVQEVSDGEYLDRTKNLPQFIGLQIPVSMMQLCHEAVWKQCVNTKFRLMGLLFTARSGQTHWHQLGSDLCNSCEAFSP